MGHNVRSYDPATENDVDIVEGKLVVKDGGAIELQGGTVGDILTGVTEVTFTEAGAGTYTGSVTVPAGSTVVDIIVNAVAQWTAGTSALMDVGDTSDPNGFFAAVDLKSGLAAGDSISFSFAGGKAGAYLGATTVKKRYYATGGTISGVVVASGTDGTAGRTRMIVLYAAPATIVAATKS